MKEAKYADCVRERGKWVDSGVKAKKWWFTVGQFHRGTK